MSKLHLVGFRQGKGFLYQLSGTSKLLFFVIVSIVCMTTYDTRLLLGVCLLSLLLFKFAGIRLKDYSFVLWLVVVFAVLNVLMIYIFAPQYGDAIYGQTTRLLDGPAHYDLSLEQLFYLFNVALKYVCTVPLALLFLITTHPSQFASSLNKLGVNYKIAYAINLTLRYIPDVQEEFYTIKHAQEARGLDLSKKAGLVSRIKGHLRIVLPLIMGSLHRINVVSQSMELRRFGRYKKRTWYTEQPLSWQDIVTVCLAVSVVFIGIWLAFANNGRFYNPFQ